MKAMQVTNAAVAAAVMLMAAVAGPLNPARAEGPVLKSTNLGELDSWYGRAGGTIGAERIQTLHAAQLPPADVATTYDKGVAERTNMGRGDVPSQSIGISYDKAVAERTNMSRGEASETSVVAK